jgi:hypothetical protein
MAVFQQRSPRVRSREATSDGLAHALEAKPLKELIFSEELSGADARAFIASLGSQDVERSAYLRRCDVRFAEDFRAEPANFLFRS